MARLSAPVNGESRAEMQLESRPDPHCAYPGRDPGLKGCSFEENFHAGRNASSR